MINHIGCYHIDNVQAYNCGDKFFNLPQEQFILRCVVNIYSGFFTVSLGRRDIGGVH